MHIQFTEKRIYWFLPFFAVMHIRNLEIPVWNNFPGMKKPRKIPGLFTHLCVLIVYKALGRRLKSFKKCFKVSI